MTTRIDVAITFVIYLLFFAWVGYRRGFRAELIVFLVALTGWVFSQEFGDVLVRLANLGGKFISFAAAGGLGADADAGFEALRSAPDIITEANREGFLFVVWVLVLVITYIASSNAGNPARRKGSTIPFTPGAIFETFAGVLTGQVKFGASAPPDARLRGWAILLGAANGLLFASIFLPRLLALLLPEGVAYPGLPLDANAFQILANGLGAIVDNLERLWDAIRPVGPLVLLLILTLFLVIVADSLRGAKSNAKAKS